MPNPIVLSHYQVKPLLQAHRQGLGRAQASVDLGLSLCEVSLSPTGIAFPTGESLAWQQAEEICAEENTCYRLEAGSSHKIAVFSDETGRYYSLYPTAGAPTMLVSGIPMHRIKDTDPHRDTLEKIRAARPVVGTVLDTCTGLGYTAIEAAKTAEHVTTIELDPAALAVARQNPWSARLFDLSNITQRIGDSFDLVEGMEESSFTRILHDPPAFALAGHLYSAEFYAELWRVLRRNGKVFHYIGNPESKSGAVFTRGVMRRLAEVGFREVRPAPRAFGVTAVK